METAKVLSWLDHKTRFLARGRGNALRRAGGRWLERRLGEISVATDLGLLYGAVGDRDFLLSVRENRWERHTLPLFRSILRPGMRVVDGGAHIGLYTIAAAEEVGDTGQVFAFEPNPSSLYFLRKNTRVNQLSNRVRCFDVALGAANETAPFFLSAGNRSASSLFPQKDGRAGIYPANAQAEVKVAPLDNVLPRDTVVDVVKLDLEGSEVAALQGMRSILGRHTPLWAFIECNPRALVAASSSADELLDLLKGYEFDVTVIDEASRTTRRVRTRDLAGGYVNLFCRRV